MFSDAAQTRAAGLPVVPQTTAFLRDSFMSIHQTSIVFAPTIDALVAGHIRSHQTAGVDWPSLAQFAIVFRTSTWPCGWDKESTISFFDSEASMKLWLKSYAKWSLLEDNYIAYQGYKWDLGPTRMDDVCCDGVPLLGPATLEVNVRTTAL